MPVTSFLNQKGGVGKTSCCHHLAGAFVQMGRRVLLLDNDPQASLTQGLIGPEETLALLPEATLAAVLAGDAPFPEQIIRKVCPGIDLIPGSDALEFYDNYPPERESLESQCCLRDFLAEIRDRYDHILIDCRPAVRLCSWRALAAADSLVIPLQAEDYGAQGVPKMLDSVDMVRAAVNPDLRHGFVITMNNPRKSIQKVYEDTVRLTYGDAVFKTVLPHATDYPEAVSARKPVSFYKPRGAAAKAMKALAEEIESRVAVGSAA